MKHLLTMMLATLMAGAVAHAQEGSTEGDRPRSTEEIGEAVDGLGERVTTVENELDKLKATKVSGYVQAEWQHFDQTTSVGGRAFYSDARRDLFTIRRGRVKVQHRFGSIMSGVVQFDVTERGLEMKDAYLHLNLLPDETATDLSLFAGAFNKPNYEVELSSSSRESTERSQVVRAFYPGERDLGVMLQARHEITPDFDPRLQIGIFNGNGPVPETDAYKDLITRLTFPLPLGSESPVQIDLGGSFYYGGIPQRVDSLRKTIDGATILVANEESGSFAGYGNRRNANVEAQIYLDLLPIGGTIIKGEYLTGVRPTQFVAAVARDTVRYIAGTPATPFQLRNQAGYYLYVVQNFGALAQVAAKLDHFDRNTDMSGAQVSSTSDAASTVLGLGGSLFIDHLRITLWYEIPTYAAGENIQRGSDGRPIAEYRDTDLKDNKTTLRLQYKF